MIQTIEGRIGGGKTYTAMGWICNHLAKGGVVATNINIQSDGFKDQYGKKRGIRWVLDKHFDYTLQDSQIINLSDTKTVPYVTKKGSIDLNEIVMFYKLVPRGTPDQPVLVVIDEAHIHFPQDGHRSIPKEVLHFLTLSRHACVDVVFISQHIKNMWCQMLRLAQFRWMVRDMKKYGAQLGMFSIPWPFPHILQNKNDYDGKTIIKRNFEWIRKYLFETYKSPELVSAFESMPVAASVKIEKRGLSLKDKLYIFVGGFAVGLAVLAVPACKAAKVDEKPACIEEQRATWEEINYEKKVDIAEKEENNSLLVERYKGHVSCGWDSKMWIGSRTYYIGDVWEGYPIVKFEDHLIITFDLKTEEYHKFYIE